MCCLWCISAMSFFLPMYVYLFVCVCVCVCMFAPFSLGLYLYFSTSPSLDHSPCLSLLFCACMCTCSYVCVCVCVCEYLSHYPFHRVRVPACVLACVRTCVPTVPPPDQRVTRDTTPTDVIHERTLTKTNCFLLLCLQTCHQTPSLASALQQYPILYSPAHYRLHFPCFDQKSLSGATRICQFFSLLDSRL